MQTKRYQEIASLLKAIENCQKADNHVWEEEHGHTLENIMSSAPSGSGIDTGTTLDRERSTPEHLVFQLSYHHMNEGGYYDGWTDHTLHVTPSLAFDTNLRLTGPNRNDIKSYLYDVYGPWLDETIDV